jgi:hypothetical protein
MTRNEFIGELNKKGYRYELEGDKIIVKTLSSYIDLDELETLPDNVIFNNKGDVWVKNLASIPTSVEFRNGGDVSLDRLTGDFFEQFGGNVEGISYMRLLNFMIKKGMFI